MSNAHGSTSSTEGTSLGRWWSPWAAALVWFVVCFVGSVIWWVSSIAWWWVSRLWE